MSAVEIRAEINSYLEKAQDESFLKVVHSMLATYLKENEDPIIGYDIEGNPKRASVMVKVNGEELRVEVVDIDHTAIDPEVLKERFNR